MWAGRNCGIEIGAATLTDGFRRLTGGHSHTRNAFGRDRGHKVVTETLAIFLVVTGSQDISGSGHGVSGIFLGAVCIILISDSCHSIQHSLAMHTYIAMQAKSMYV